VSSDFFAVNHSDALSETQANIMSVDAFLGGSRSLMWQGYVCLDYHEVNHCTLVSHSSPLTHCGISLMQPPLLPCTVHLPLLHFLYLHHPWLHHLDFPSPSHLISHYPNHWQSPMVSRKVRQNCHKIQHHVPTFWYSPLPLIEMANGSIPSAMHPSKYYLCYMLPQRTLTGLL